MAMTMTQKILAAHAGLEHVEAGQLIETELDLVLGNDITSPVAINEFEKCGADAVFCLLYTSRDIATKLSNLDRLVRYCSIGIVLVLSIVSLFIIANTVKVTMFSRRMEINIMKSVGATNGFVRIPFIVEGIVIGILLSLIHI